jgi:hypothetical protein
MIISSSAHIRPSQMIATDKLFVGVGDVPGIAVRK